MDHSLVFVTILATVVGIVCCSDVVFVSKTGHSSELEPYQEQWEKSDKENLYQRMEMLEQKLAYLTSDKGMLELLGRVFDNPPSYLQSFLVNLSRKKYDTRQVAKKIKKWAN